MEKLAIKPPSQLPRRFSLALNILLSLAAVAAVLTLAAEYGFRTPPVKLRLLYISQIVIVGVFMFDRLARWALAAHKGKYFKDNWLDIALVGAVCLALVASRFFGKPGGKLLAAGALWVLISQIYILIALVLGGVSINLHFAGSGIRPAWLLVGSFAILCLIGSGLLMLPVAVPENSPAPYYIDALFTATSATCVTGLIVRDTGTDWSPFGQGVILTLIQLGALGLMMFGTMLALMLGKGLSLRGADAMGQVLATKRIGQVSKTIGFVVLVTLGAEAVGAMGLYGMFASASENTAAPAGTAAWQSIFHSISSFCNAGFSLFDQNMAEGVRAGWEKPLRDHWQIMAVMAPLIILGGLGFPVIQNCAATIWYRVKRFVNPGKVQKTLTKSSAPRPRLSLHSKLVLTTTAALIVIGALGLFLLDPSGGPAKQAVGYHPTIDMGSGQAADWPTENLPRRIRDSLFQSVTARTAGFNTIDMAELSSASKAWMCGLMLIGGSPASTAGGMKTVTFALLILTVYSTLRKRPGQEAFGRSIPREILAKSTTIGVLYMALAATVTLLLAASMPGVAFIDLLFEASSACGTVGLSTGVTRQLNVFGKCVIIAAMFLGRIGPVTLLAAMANKARPAAYEYPSESVLVG